MYYFHTEILMASSTPRNVATNSVISVNNTPFSFSNIDLNDLPVDKFSISIFKTIPESLVDFECANIMSGFDNKSLKNDYL